MEKIISTPKCSIKLKRKFILIFRLFDVWLIDFRKITGHAFIAILYKYPDYREFNLTN